MIKIHRHEDVQATRYASIRNKSNAAINKSLDEQQHTALAIIAGMRHELHSTKDWYFFVPEEEQKSTLNFFDKLCPILLKTAKLPQMDISMDIFKEKVQRYDETVAETIEQINNAIETYLGNIDRKYGTDYCPTGFRRQRREERLTHFYNREGEFVA